jgi:hypothetical protein
LTIPSPSCSHCGKNLTTDDLRRVDCRHCGTVLPHHARAAQQVAVINQMMVDRNGNGIPDAFEPLVHNAQANAMNQAFGIGTPHVHAAHMGMGMGPGVHVAHVHVAHANAMHQQANTVAKSMALVGIFIAVAVVLVIGVAVGVAVFLSAAH